MRVLVLSHSCTDSSLPIFPTEFVWLGLQVDTGGKGWKGVRRARRGKRASRPFYSRQLDDVLTGFRVSIGLFLLSGSGMEITRMVYDSMESCCDITPSDRAFGVASNGSPCAMTACC